MNQEPQHRDRAFSLSALAGLETGVIGAFALLIFLGAHAALRGQSWWSYANLVGSVVYRHSALWRGFGRATLAGLAVQIIGGGLAGLLFGVCFARTRGRTVSLLIGVSCGVIWFFITFQFIYTRIGPLVPVYASQPATLLGHMILGLVLSRTSALYDELAPRLLPQPAASPSVGLLTAPSGIPDASQLNGTGEIVPRHRLE